MGFATPNRASDLVRKQEKGARKKEKNKNPPRFDGDTEGNLKIDKGNATLHSVCNLKLTGIN